MAKEHTIFDGLPADAKVDATVILLWKGQMAKVREGLAETHTLLAAWEKYIAAAEHRLAEQSIRGGQ